MSQVVKKRAVKEEHDVKQEAKQELQEIKQEAKQEKRLGKPMPSIFDEAPPLPMRKLRADKGGGATALSKLQGVVTRVREETVGGPKGPIHKVRIDFVVTGVVTNGAGDVLDTGVPGEVYYLPSRQVDTPEQAEGGDGKFKLKSRELVLDGNSKLRKVSTASMSFYKESKDGGSTGVNACAPGMTVEVSGVCVNAGLSRQGLPSLYLNGGKVTCTMSEAPSPGALAPHMMALCKSNAMQKWSAFGCSLPAQGFFQVDGSEGQRAQAAAGQALWRRLVESAADRLGALASGKDEDVAAALGGHEQRVRATDPAALARGEVALFLVEPFDCTIAPIVNAGVAPWDKRHLFYQELVAGGERARALPASFAMPLAWQVCVNGNGVSIEARVLCCFDKQSALQAMEQGEANPLLADAKSAVCMQLSMKDMALKFGNNAKQKLTFAVQQVLPVADFAAFPKLSQIESTSAGDSVKADFPEGGTLYIEMCSTLKKAGVLVPEELIKMQLCEGNTQYVPDADPSERFPLPDGVTALPTFATHGFQELTQSSAAGVGGFKFSNFKVPSDKTREYRVLYDGCMADLASDSELATDAEKGKAHIENVAALATDCGLEVKDFLAQKCLVYAIMV